MTALRSSVRVAAAALVLAAAACVHGPSDREVVWRPHVVWDSGVRVHCAKTGDADPRSPGPEAVAADEAGRVIVVRGPSLTAEVVYEHGCRLTGLLVADVDPDVPGEEIYAGGHLSGETGGAVVQISLAEPGAPRVRRVVEGGAFVHALAAIPPADDRPAELVIGDYAGEVRIATPRSGSWATRLAVRDTPTDDPESLELKDAVAGPVGGRGPRTTVVVSKSGRVFLIDPDRGTAETIHTEPGGVARAAVDTDGRVWLAGTKGRVVRLSPQGAAWSAEPIFQDTDGVRGIVVGAFAVGDRTADAVVYGYARACRALVPGAGGAAWTSSTLFEDRDRGHWLAAADLVPGDGRDELVLASYSGRVVVLVATEGGSR